MKIGIITRRAGFNMGTSLQALAMSKFVAEAGFCNEIIDYNEYSGHLTWRIKPFIKRVEWLLISRIPFLSKFFPDQYKRLDITYKQISRFNEFERDFFPLSHRKYNSFKSLEKSFDDYDACICGSDQIWSPYYFDSAFFLSFLSKNSKCLKIAYAPSIGVTNKNLIGQNQVDLMKAFDYISCREQEGADVLSELLDRPVTTVLDPTLMVNKDFWYNLERKSNLKIEGKYILTYFLHHRLYNGTLPLDYVKRLKEKTGLPVYNISLFNLLNDIDADRTFNTIGPLEFLSLIKNAEFICTNSFHCCIFSFLFKRKFYVFERFMKNSAPGGNQNSRIHNLLKLCHMESSMVNPEDDVRLSHIYDFEQGEKNIEIHRNLSLAFLKDSLKVK